MFVWVPVFWRSIIKRIACVDGFVCVCFVHATQKYENILRVQSNTIKKSIDYYMKWTLSFWFCVSAIEKSPTKRWFNGRRYHKHHFNPMPLFCCTYIAYFIRHFSQIWCFANRIASNKFALFYMLTSATHTHTKISNDDRWMPLYAIHFNEAQHHFPVAVLYSMTHIVSFCMGSMHSECFALEYSLYIQCP